MRIAIASDHAALTLKSALVAWLGELGHDVRDLGPDSAERVDYPDYGYKLAAAIADGRRRSRRRAVRIGHRHLDRRQPQPRCALRTGQRALSAALAREHNDANVIALGARLIGEDMAKACVTAFLTTDFAGDRHIPRVEKLGRPPYPQEPA